MKKNVHFILLLIIVSLSLNAQPNSKFYETEFVGALSGLPAEDWTQGWTNWNPKNTAYPAVTDANTLDGMAAGLPVVGEKRITNTLTLDANQVYLLKGIIVVDNGGKLVIPAGTIIRAQADLSTNPKNYACIVVERGGKIEVDGSLNKPVVITSNKETGSRERGDWGGLLIAGRGTHNLANPSYDNVQMEGFNNVSFSPGLAKFGGNDPNDNSGFLKYLRIEFPGLAFETNKELNGLTFGAVGSATEVDNVQVSFSNDDSFEWFGGSVNSRHIIAFKGTDDDFDTDNGYSGLNQYGIALRDSDYYDLTYSLSSGSSTSEAFESDNEATGTAAVSPYTNAVFSNFTLVGPVPVGTKYSELNSTAKSAFRRGARIRRNSSLRVVNSIFMGYRNFVMVDGDSSLRNTNYDGILPFVTPNTAVDQKTKQLFFTNNLIVNTNAAFTSATDTTANGLVEVARGSKSGDKLNALDSWIRQSGPLANNINPVEFTTGTVLVNPLAATTTPNFNPVNNSPALSGANFVDNPILSSFISATEEIEKATKATTIFPNPIRQGELNFGQNVASFGVFDSNANLILSGFNASSVNIDRLNNGMYFVKFNGQVQKFIVIK